MTRALAFLSNSTFDVARRHVLVQECSRLVDARMGVLDVSNEGVGRENRKALVNMEYSNHVISHLDNNHD
jgi:hypothetical protein